MSYPVISNYIESREQADQIDTYNSSVSELSRANKQLMLNEAHEWNDNLYSKEKGLPEDSGLEYENVLDLGNGVIGTVEIPKIKVNMPVYHGTDSDVLNVGAGHIEDSSLPVGGNNTHRLVITGKRVPYKKKEKKSIKSSIPSLREIIFYVIPVLFSVAGILFFRKRGVKNV